jgi:CheY-like chemotaxis protein
MKTILYVEDNELNRKIVRDLLKRNPNMRYAMEQVFTGDLVRKLRPRHQADTWHSS